MKFTRLRLSGFKSFVDPTELLVEPGLTGIVGPNGCGKSNLLEALRWAMGETSYKSLRGSGMDDVIFSGSAQRPGRNTAEVTLTLDNSDRTAPAQFNDEDVLEISRRIEREAGSAYRINGRDVRARDVQVLFADAATGAHSVALVRQGQIGELIAAKPEGRRRILEEAAGISGLHHRRHEAELRLNAAMQNLARLDDVIGEIANQMQALQRQARQAARYRRIAQDIRQSEALLAHLKWADARDALADHTTHAQTLRTRVEGLSRDAALATLEEEKAAQAPPGLRDLEAQTAAALQRLKNEDRFLSAETERVAARRAELEARSEQITGDSEREAQILTDLTAQIGAIETEAQEITQALAGADDALRTTEAEVHSSQSQHDTDQHGVDKQTQILAELRAAHTSLATRRAEADQRVERLEQELARIAGNLGSLSENDTITDTDHEAEAAGAEKQASELAGKTQHCEQQQTKARAAQDKAGEAAALAQRDLDRLEAEHGAMVLVAADNSDTHQKMVDLVTVAAGYEAALAAALGEDLEASNRAETALLWRPLDTLIASPFPAGIEPLTDSVAGPPELARRLAFTGVVTGQNGDALQTQLLPGQRLVSRAGDLWRWDGFVARAGSPTAASRRLEARNRVGALAQEIITATRIRDQRQGELTTAQTARGQADANDRAARNDWRAATEHLAALRQKMLDHEKETRAAREKRTEFTQALERISEDLTQARSAKNTIDATQIDNLDEAQARLEPLREAAAASRAALAQAQGRAGTLAGAAQAREARLESLKSDANRWRERGKNAAKQRDTLKTRMAQIADERRKLSTLPEEISEKRTLLADRIGEAEIKRKAAADVLAKAENRLAELTSTSKRLSAEFSDARENLARRQAQQEAALERLTQTVEAIFEALATKPEGALAQSGFAPDDALPAPDETEARLNKLKTDRDRLGAVNLRAEEEAAEQSRRYEDLTTETQDLQAAIKRLRQGIHNLNAQARERLLVAFDAVNKHFGELFAKLFGGGTAELVMTEADDPLDAGLEIIARPPGKKPQTLSLLSGGEQALTALALILAVFRTNPSPICVLDEVDAPLDDANVERFCNLITGLAQEVDTRFLVISHHPFTMARMDRLFGVTMAEHGVSQLVSVDLDNAARYREAV
ncbi:MAG: chromosome segregation SMC family protein, partial [Alphaproteobacteria bacterium]